LADVCPAVDLVRQASRRSGALSSAAMAIRLAVRMVFVPAREASDHPRGREWIVLIDDATKRVQR
jgi:hypothetical protein